MTLLRATSVWPAKPSQLGAVVARYYEFVDEGKIDALLGCFANDAVYERPGWLLDGRAELARFYRQERIIVSGKHTIDDVVDIEQHGPDGRFLGFRVIVQGTFGGLLRAELAADGETVAEESADGALRAEPADAEAAAELSTGLRPVEGLRFIDVFTGRERIKHRITYFHPTTQVV
jgi:hypothetical protein